MDPQKLSQLDPKLRDAYQRVMGTPIPAPVQVQTPPMPTPPMPDPNPVPPAPQPEPPMPPPAGGPTPPIQEPSSIPTPPEPAIPQPEPSIPQQPPVAANNYVQMNSQIPSTPISANFSVPMPQAQTIAIKKKSGMMPLLIGASALVFLVVYTLFWTKLFNFKIPFLP